MKNLIFKSKGFTLIELLIVIALIGILAVALLSAINPLEQLRKGRDSARKADAAELLNAIERFQASYQCYPWDYDLTIGTCLPSFVPLGGASGTVTIVDTTLFDSATGLLYLRGEGAGGVSAEIKEEYNSRVTTAGSPSFENLFAVEVGAVPPGAEGMVRICFEAESQTGRTGGMGRMVNDIATDPLTYVTGVCAGDYSGALYDATNCHICVPQ